MILSKSVRNINRIFSRKCAAKCFLRACSSSSSSPNCPKTEINVTIPQDQRIQLGQPTAKTHPHLLNNGFVLPEITLEELRNRRNGLMERIDKASYNLNKEIKSNIVIIPSAVTRYMSDKIPYVFRQNSDFLYFSGCLEPDSILVMTTDVNKNVKSVLFMRPKDKHAELWDGPRTGTHFSLDLFGVNESYTVKEFSSYVSSFLKLTNGSKFGVWYDSKTSSQPEVGTNLKSILASQNLPPAIMESPLLYSHQMRVFKSPAEIKLMKMTCDIGAKSINRTMAESKPGDSEHHLFARVDYYSRMNNANYLAYPPVVAAGNNGTTIHYIKNSQIIPDGDLVLMDAGCDYAGYSSDITRTWPINGNFTEVQRVLYEVVLVVQKELIECLNSGEVTALDQLFDTMCLKLGAYLQEVGLIRKGISSLELSKAAYSFCPHHVSHYLGMDVHDTPLISRSINMKPGMVCTVEPGIYISADRLDVPEEFRGIGIRVEDDVLIKDGSVEVLSEKCVKEIADIERLIKN